MTAATRPPGDGAAALFAEAFGRVPDALFSAPGRVNLIGEHTDYNNGLVLPFAIDARAAVAAARNTHGRLRFVSAQRRSHVVDLPARPLAPGSARGWAGYLAGAVWSLRAAGHDVGGFDFALDSAVPVGAGLSSSAAVECATVLAAATLSGIDLDPAQIARIAQRAENDFVGVPCGLMDQMASAACRPGQVLFFDIGADTVEHIPFDPAAAGLQTLLIDTRAHHSLADGEYARRRDSCEQAAAELGLASLRDISDLDDALDRLSDDLLRRRVRHVVTENARVAAVVEKLRDGRVTEIGPEMTASHASLRDDYEVSAAELDVTVDAALMAGALGARMTGGGFGGSVITLIPVELADEVATAVREAFRRRGFTAPVLRPVRPAGGASVDRVG